MGKRSVKESWSVDEVLSIGEGDGLLVHAVEVELLEISLAVEVAAEVEGGSLAGVACGDGWGSLVNEGARYLVGVSEDGFDKDLDEVTVVETLSTNLLADGLVNWVVIGLGTVFAKDEVFHLVPHDKTS